MKTLQGHVFGAATAARVLQGAINSEGSGRWLSKEKKFHGLLDPMTIKQKVIRRWNAKRKRKKKVTRHS